MIQFGGFEVRKAFTIIELLVAGLLLGMLMSVLTMVFNQSSIAWRIGVAGVADLDLVRDNIAELREEADNVYLWNGHVHRILGVWDESSQSGPKLRDRAIDAENSSTFETRETAQFLKNQGGLNKNTKPKDLAPLLVGSGVGSKSFQTYVVNVKSAGPNKEFNDWDDIWSFPDDFE
jgi:type II secretory pathway pseudopilin PulG